MKYLFVINLKTYKFGKEQLKLAKQIEKINKDIIIGAPATDIYFLSKNTKLQIYAEHVDAFEPGRNTGYILAEAVKAAGAKGVFLNHSEHRIDYNILTKTIKHCKKLKLKIMVFAKDTKEAKQIEKLKPDFIIIEPPELVGGNVSVSQAKPDLIKKIKKSLKSKFLVGAGIHTKEDITTALKLGASGIALSSAITTAKNPSKKLKELIN